MGRTARASITWSANGSHGSYTTSTLDSSFSSSSAYRTGFIWHVVGSAVERFEQAVLADTKVAPLLKVLKLKGLFTCQNLKLCLSFSSHGLIQSLRNSKSLDTSLECGQDRALKEVAQQGHLGAVWNASQSKITKETRETGKRSGCPLSPGDNLMSRGKGYAPYSKGTN